MSLNTRFGDLERRGLRFREAGILRSGRDWLALALALGVVVSFQILGCSDNSGAGESDAPENRLAVAQDTGKTGSESSFLGGLNTEEEGHKEEAASAKASEPAQAASDADRMEPPSGAEPQEKANAQRADQDRSVKAEPVSLDDIHPLRVTASGEIIPLAPMGKKKPGPSPLENAPGYERPPDPERHTVETGRREVEKREIAFDGGVESPDALAILMLDGLRRGDRELLKSVRVNYKEFSEILWPEFPQSRPATNLEASDSWFFLDRQSAGGMAKAIRMWEGKDFILDKIDYEVGFAPYTNFHLFHGVRLHVHTRDGEYQELSFAEAFAECGGKWKVYTYKD